MGVLVDGGAMLEEVLSRVPSRCPSLSGKRVVIIRSGPWSGQKPGSYLASEISTGEKIKCLQRAGCEIRYQPFPAEVTTRVLASILRNECADPEIAGIIVQGPMPAELAAEIRRIVDPERDLDAFTGPGSRFSYCAVAEAAVRLAEPLIPPGNAVAVVGCRGYVGTSVGLALESKSLPFVGLDLEDDICRVREARCVISAAGCPGLLGPADLSPEHRLVVDIGFTPRADLGTVEGDVQPAAYPVVQLVTPVPGGLGPLSHAVLLERLCSLVSGRPVELWNGLHLLTRELTSSPGPRAPQRAARATSRRSR